MRSRAACFRLSSVAAAVGLALQAPPSFAAGSRVQGDDLQEVVVTARFREENLRRSITNPNDKPVAPPPPAKPADGKPEAGKPSDKTGDKAAGQTTPPTTPVDPDEPPKEQAADYQLLRAADLIRGISLYSSKAN